MIEKLNVRKITLSGGEPTIIGGVILKNFIELIDHIRGYKENYPDLRIELLTNAILLEREILVKLVGVVDRITITLDTINEDVLKKIGRNTPKYKNYLGRFRQRMIDISELGFETKIHSVVTPVNYDYLEELAIFIKRNNHLFKINRWKLYQYMTYDDPIKDAIYEIDDKRYGLIKAKINNIIADTNIDVTFKDNKLMIDSMLNLNHDGRLEHITISNGNKEKYLSKQIWNYDSIDKLIKDLHISLDKLNYYHGYSNE
jgi:MoaA/NifB/PqqE/SkfB family radical SAM enzyme